MPEVYSFIKNFSYCTKMSKCNMLLMFLVEESVNNLDNRRNKFASIWIYQGISNFLHIL